MPNSSLPREQKDKVWQCGLPENHPLGDHFILQLAEGVGAALDI